MYRAIACFDMDGTLVSGDSGALFVRFCAARRLLTISELAGWSRWLVRIAIRGLHEPELAEAKRLLLLPWLRWGEARSEELYEQFFDQIIKPRLRRAAVEEVEIAQREGPVFIITANLRSMAVRLGKDLGIPDSHCIGAEPIRDSGGLTGEVRRPLAIGEERAKLMSTLAAREGVELKNVRAYGNSLHDLAMLRAAGKPCAVAPSRALRRIALREGIRLLE